MTLLILNLSNLSARVGKLAIAAALVIGIVALGAPAVTEAAGATQTGGASEDFIFTLLALAFGCIVAGVAMAGDALAGLASQAGL